MTKSVCWGIIFLTTRQAEMVEWSITAVLKTVEMRVSGGSNPSLRAKNTGRITPSRIFFDSENREGFEGGSRFAGAKRFALRRLDNGLHEGKGRR